MKISTLIIHLRELQSKYGDLEVVTGDSIRPLQAPVTSVKKLDGFQERTKVLQMLMPSRLYKEDRVLIE